MAYRGYKKVSNVDLSELDLSVVHPDQIQANPAEGEPRLLSITIHAECACGNTTDNAEGDGWTTNPEYTKYQCPDCQERLKPQPTQEEPTVEKEHRVGVWKPGGENCYMDRESALNNIDLWWNNPQGWLWECRVLSACAEQRWASRYHTTLGAAVNGALDWKRLGLSRYQAALVCFDTDLVVSTDVENIEQRGLK